MRDAQTMNIKPFEQHTPQIAEGVYIDDSALVIGDVHIGKDSSIWPMVVVRGDIHRIRIGERTNIQDASVLHVTHESQYVPEGFPLTIGHDVTVGHGAVLHGCTIGSACLIGMGAVILDGAVLEDLVMLGAHALVPPGKTCETGYLYVGSPAKKIRGLTREEVDFLQYSADSYVALKNRY
jgi:carbonic anhydrase/acetyltransferase-like protein (isoleucine patch superfamily)